MQPNLRKRLSSLKKKHLKKPILTSIHRSLKRVWPYFVTPLILIVVASLFFLAQRNTDQAKAAGETIQFQSNSGSITESIGQTGIPVTLSAAIPTNNVTVNYTITGGTATQNTDYTLTATNQTNPLTIPAGKINATIPVKIINNTAVNTNKTIQLTLSSPAGAVLGTPTTFTLTILDDDSNYEPLGGDPETLPNFDNTGVNTLNVTEGLRLQLDAQSLPTGDNTGDPNYSGVQLLLHGNGANGATTTTDNSGYNNAIAFNGNASISTAQSQFGGSSYTFDGSGDYLTLPTNFTNTFGPIAGNSYTIETWIRPTDVNNRGIIGSYKGVAVNGRWNLRTNASSQLQFGWTTGTGSEDNVSHTTVITNNQWQHVAVIVDATNPTNSTVQLAVNGQMQTFTGKNMSSQTTTYDAHRVGGNMDYINDFAGQIDEMRITKGVKRYTANFTPPTSAFLDYGNTIDGTAVSSWTDSSSSGNNATQNTPANQPTVIANALNGKQVVRFNGTTQSLNSTNNPITNSSTIFSVSKANDTTARSIVNFGTGTTTATIGQATATAYTAQGGSDLGSGINISTSSAGLFATTYDTTTMRTFVNGVAGATGDRTTTVTTGGFRVGVSTAGNTAYFNGDIAEILVYNRTLNDNERKQVECYLANKYALSSVNCTDGLKLRLDANAISGNDGDFVGTWSDTSGSGNNATQAGADTLKPTLKKGINGINSQNVVRFDGTDDLLNLPNFLNFSSQQASQFVVLDNKSNTQHFAAMETGSNTGDVYWGSSSVFSYNGYWSEFRTTRIEQQPKNSTELRPKMYTTVSGTGTGSYKIFTDGKLEATDNPAWGVSTSPKVGGGYNSKFLNGNIAEILIYNRALNDTERKQVECYLSKKYNLKASGCEGSTKLWLDASQISGNDGDFVGTWSDSSGSGNNATNSGTARPTLKTGANGLNGKNMLRFDGGDDFLSAGDKLDLGPDNFSVLAVSKFNNATGAAIVSKSSTRSLVGRWALTPDTGKTVLLFHDSGGVNLVGNASVNTQPNINTGIINRGQKTTHFLNGSGNGESAGVSSTTNFDTTDSLYVGQYGNSTGTGPLVGYYLNGDIAEILVLNTALNTTQRTIYENYLASKYGITISNNSSYTLGSTAPNQLVGIGSSSDGALTNSGSSSGLYLSELNRSLSSTETLLAGNDGGEKTIVSTDLPNDLNGANSRRFNRTWGITKAGGADPKIDAKVSFDLSEYAQGIPSTATNYKLLYRLANSGTFATVTTTNPTITGDKISFDVANNNLTNGYYTLATTDNTNSPLSAPNAITDLTATPQTGNNSDKVNLTWTAPGGNPTSYTVQYSDDNFVNDIQTLPTNPTTNSAQITGLNTNTKYAFRVLATNSAGTGNGSNTSTVTTSAGSPTITSIVNPDYNNATGATTGGYSVTVNGNNFVKSGYKRTITINNTAGTALSDYQVSFTLDTASLISSGKMRSDCGDLRLTDSDEFTGLPYWIESGCNTASTIIWTKIPSIDASSNKDIYVKYGDLTKTSAQSSPDTIFDFYDGFDGTVIDSSRWVNNNTSKISQNNKLIFNGGNYSWGTTAIYSNTNFDRTAGKVLEYDLNFVGQNDTMFGWKNTTTGTAYPNLVYAYHVSGTTNNYIYEDGASRGSIPPNWAYKNYKIRMSAKPAGNIYERSEDGGTTWVTHYNSTYSSANPLKIGFDNYNTQMEIDNLKVRKYTATPPTITTAAEQTTSTTTLNFGTSNPATNVNVVNSTQITATVPASNLTPKNGVATVTLDQSGATATSSFEYKAPRADSLNITSGPTAGGTEVIVNGGYFGDTGFSKQITLTNPGNYTEIPLKGSDIGIDTLKSQNKLQSDCRDLRIKDTDGTTDLPFWLDGNCDNNGTVWVKFSTAPASGKVIFAKYNNDSTATNQGGNVSNVFSALVPSSNRLWFKANDGTGTTVDGASISQWTDKSGNGNNALQATTSSQPILKTNLINGRSVVRFDGSNDTLLLANADTIHQYYTVFKSNTVSFNSYGGVIEKSHLSGGCCSNRMGLFESGQTYFHSNPYPRAVRKNGTNLASPFTLAPINSYMLMTVGTNNPTLSRNMQLGSEGSTYFSNIDVAEIVGFNKDLSTLEQAQVENYLNLKYNLYNTSNSPTTGFSAELSASKVYIGANEATSVQRISPTQLKITTPANTAGTYAVKVVASDNTESNTDITFTYAAPTVTSVTPAIGPNSGGQYIEIKGSNFGNTGNKYIRTLQVNNTSGNSITDYIGNVDLDTASLISSGKMKNDCGDIRVKDGNNADPLGNSDTTNVFSYWIEGCNSRATTVWFKIPTLNTGTKSLYLSYGDNNLSTTAENISTLISQKFPILAQSSNKLWIAASDLNLANNATVSTINNKANTNNNLTLQSGKTEGTFNNNAINGRPAITLANNRSYSFTRISDIRTVFWVLKENTSGGFLLGDTSAYNFHRNGQYLWHSCCSSSNVQNGETRVNNELITPSTDAKLIVGTPTLVSLVTTGNTQADSLTEDRGGYNRSFDGDIAEVIVFNSALSTNDRQAVENYLNLKYKLYNTTSIISPTINNEQRIDVKIGGNSMSGVTFIDSQTLRGYTPAGTGNVNIKVTNSDGSNGTSATNLYSYGQSNVPNPITDLTLGTQEGGNVNLSWTTPFNNGSAITNHIIRYSQNDFTTYTDFNTQSNTNSTTVTGLNIGQSYKFKVIAVNGSAQNQGNGAGRSVDSNVVSVANLDCDTNLGGLDLIISSNQTLTGSYCNINLFQVNSGITATLNNQASTTAPFTGKAVKIYAQSANIIGSINGVGTGYAGGVNSGGNGPGAGQFSNGSSNGGAGYGGRGGSTSTLGGNSYGSVTQPTDLGSGGADPSSWSARGANGGGAIKLTVAGTTTVNGSILANGETYNDIYVGGGSGGSIWIDTNTLTGSGIITANGGNSPGAGAPAGGGGGGRIALYYTTKNLTNSTPVSTIGGTGNQNGGAGTVYDKNKSDNTKPNGDLIISNLTNNTGNLTPLNDSTNRYIYDNITVQNAYLDYTKTNNTLNVINTLTLQSSATVDDTTKLATLRVNSKDTYNITNFVIKRNGVLTHVANSSTHNNSTIINSTTLDIQTGGKIDVSNLGYTGGVNSAGNGPGAGQFSNGSSNGGAGYGGRGGSTSTLGGNSYGSVTQPTDLGSGGADPSSWSARGANGGGAIKLTVAGTTTVNGSILANGETYNDIYVGGGSGGSIWIDTNTLTGSGIITANGGNSPGAGAPAGGGAGGRIALYYQARSGSMTQVDQNSSITVNGGTGTGDCSEPTITETFTDTNSNGYYDLGETFVDVVAPGNTAGRRDEKAAYTNTTSGCTGTLYDGNSPEAGLSSLVSSNLSPNPNPISVGSDFSLSVTGIKNTFGFNLFSGTCSADIIRTTGTGNYTTTVSSVSGTILNGVCTLVGPASGGKFLDPGGVGQFSVKVTAVGLATTTAEFKNFLSLTAYATPSNKAKANGTEPISPYTLTSTPVPSLIGLTGNSNLLKLTVSGLIDSGNNQALNNTPCNFNVTGPSVDNSGNSITPFSQTFTTPASGLVGGICSYTFGQFDLPLIKGGYSFTVTVAGKDISNADVNLTTASQTFNRFFDIFLSQTATPTVFDSNGKIPGSATGTILVSTVPTLISLSNPIVSGGASPTFTSQVVRKYANGSTDLIPSGTVCRNLLYLDGSLIDNQASTLNATGQCVTTVPNSSISAGNLQLKTRVSLTLNSITTDFETNLTTFATAGFPSNKAQSTTFSLGGSLDTSAIPFTTTITSPGNTFIGTAQTFTVSGLKDYANNQPLAGSICTFNFTKPDGTIFNLPSSPASNGSCSVTIAGSSSDLSLKGNYSYTVTLPGTNGTGSGGSPNNVTLTTNPAISFVRRFDLQTTGSDGLTGNLVGTLSSTREPLVVNKAATLTSPILKKFDTTTNLASTIKCRNVLTINGGSPIYYPGVVSGNVTGNLNATAQCVSDVLDTQITTTGSAVLKTQVSLLDSNFDFSTYGDDFQTADKTISIVNAYSNKAKAKDNPNQTQPASNTPTVSVNPSFTDQSVTLSVSNLIDSGNDLALETTSQICRFNITNPNGTLLSEQTAAPTNGTCTTSFTDNSLESNSGFSTNYSFTLRFNSDDSSTGQTLTTNPVTNIQRRFNIYRTSSQLPAAITTSTAGYTNILIKSTANTLTSGAIQQSNTPANLQAGTSLSALTGKACRIVLIVNSATPSYYPATLDGSGRCIANLLSSDSQLQTLSETVTSRVEVSYNDSTFNLDQSGNPTVTNSDDFSSANTPLKIRNLNNSSLCVQSFKDDNASGSYNNGGANGNNQIGQPEQLLSGQTISKSLYDSSNNLIGSVVSNSTNPYCFDNLFEGDYYVLQNIPANTSLTKPTVADTSATITASTAKYQVTAVSGQAITKEFGYRGNGDEVCVDQTYIDVDKNNTYSSGTDTLVSGKNTLIYLSTDLVNPITSTSIPTTGIVSDANGKTCFTNLPANNPGESYRLTQTIPVALEPFFPSGATAITGLPTLGANAYRDVTLSLTTDQTTTFGYQKSASSLAKEELNNTDQPTGRPINTGLNVLTTINPVFNEKAFVGYPVSAQVSGLIDSGNDALLSGVGICSATFEGPGFGVSGKTISNLNVLNGNCVVDNSNNSTVVPTTTGNYTVTFTITGDNQPLTTLSHDFVVFSGNISVCTSAFADYNGNGTKESNEPLIGGISAKLVRVSDSVQVGTISNLSASTISNCFAPVAPGVQYRVEQTTPAGLVLTTTLADDAFRGSPQNTTYPEDTFAQAFGYTGNSGTQVCGNSFRDDAGTTYGVNDGTNVPLDTIDPLITNSLFTTRLFDNLGNPVLADKIYTGGLSGCFTNLLPTTVQTSSGNLSYSLDQTYSNSLKVARTTASSFSILTLANAQNDTREFGYRNTADICYNDVYRDYNKDGTRQTSESIISDLPTKLYQGASQIGGTQNTTTTGNNCFNDPTPGNYEIQQTVPASYQAITSFNTNLSQPTLSTTASTTVNYSNITLNLGVDTNIGIGYKGSSGTKICANPTFKDLVAPFGDYNGSDTLYPGILTTLKDQNGNTIAGGTANSLGQTDASGNLCFDELLPAVGSSFTYKLEQTSPNAATILPSTGSLSKNIASLVVGQTASEKFGYKGSPQICPVAFRDDSGDSIKDTNEPYLSVQSYLKDNSGNTLTPTSTTANPIQSANNGENCFTFDLTAGANYQVKVTPPSGYTLLGGSDTQTVPDTLNGVQFGGRYKPVFRFDGAGSICIDSSYDNYQSQIAGLTTVLKNGTTPVQTIQTTATGSDCFSNVDPGTYSVTQTGPTGSAATTSNPANVTQNPGATEHLSFRYTGASSICVTPFNDNSITGSFDGIRQDGELFVSDTNISLYKSPDFTNPIQTLSPLTEANLCITGLYGGDYRLVQTNPPSGYSYTTSGNGTQNFTVPNSSPVNRYFGLTNDPDFNKGSIRGKLYIDRNEDSKTAPHTLADSFDPYGQDLAYQSTFDNDVPVTNQEVKLYKYNPLSANTDKYEYQTSVISASNSADNAQDGTYSFDGLLPGTYKVVVPLPQGTTSVWPSAGAGNSSFIEGIVITSSEIVQDNHLSFQYTAKICPVLYVDINYNNQYNPGIDIDLIQTVGSFYTLAYEAGSGPQTESNYNPKGYLLNSTNPCILHVPPRQYTVQVNTAANDLPGNQGGLGYTTLFNRTRYNQITPNQSTTVYLDGQTYQVTNYYNGTPPPADNNALSSLSGRLWNDKAGDGVWEPTGKDTKTGIETINPKTYNRDYDNDTPYEGIKLQLVKCGDANNDIFPKAAWNLPTNSLAYFTSRADGTYDFVSIPPGGYGVIRLDQFPNENQLTVSRTNSACDAGNYIFWNNNPGEIGSRPNQRTPGQNETNYNIWTKWNNTIVNDAYIDQNLNGTRQSFEDDKDTSITNLTYELRDSSGNILETIIEPTPGYTSIAFTHIPPGTNYIVELTSYTSNYTPFATPKLDIPLRTNLATNGTSQTLNFGFTPTTNSAIEGRVFIDRTRDRTYLPNGIDTQSVTDFDNDAPLGNYTVELYFGACGGLTNCFLPENLVATQNSINDNSANQGNFSFQNIPEGNYHARVTNPEPIGTEKGSGSGGVRTYWGQGGGYDLQNDLVYVAQDQTLQNQHLTYDYNGVFNADSFLDTVPDGIYDSNWEVRNNYTKLSLVYSQGNLNESIVILPTYRGQTSQPIFQAVHLPPGNYSIAIGPKPTQIDVRSGYLNNPYALSPSQNRSEDLPFTPYLNNTISGQVFIDRPTNLVNSSGYNQVFNPNGGDANPATILDNDIAINLATVYLQGPPGIAINPQITSGIPGQPQTQGTYTFSNLPSGKYRVHKLPDNNNASNPIPNVDLPASYTNTITDICITALRCKSSRVITNQPELWVWWDTGFDIVGQVKAGIAIENDQTITSNNVYSYTNHASGTCIDDYNGSGTIDANAITFTNDTAINGCSFKLNTPYLGESITGTTNLNQTFYELPPGNYTLQKLNNAIGRININTAKYTPGYPNVVPTPGYLSLGPTDAPTFSFTNSGLYQPGYYHFYQTTPVQTRNASITGKVFVDRNQNLSFQADGADQNLLTKEDNDYYLPNIKLTLTGTETKTGATVNKNTTTQISNDGKYQFTDLAEGSYTVTSDLVKN